MRRHLVALRRVVAGRVAIGTARREENLYSLVECCFSFLVFFRARHDVDLDLRSFVYPEHLVIVKITLLDAAVFYRDLAIESRGQSENNTAFHLCIDGVGVDHLSTVDSADDTMDLRLAVFS